jgi:carbamoyltransferase
MLRTVVGISAYYHDSAACVLRDGQLVAAAQEERFTRRRHDASFPRLALRSCLEQAKLSISEIDLVVFYEKPLVKFFRLLETYLSFAPAGIRSFLAAMPGWIRKKLFQKKTIHEELLALRGGAGGQLPQLLFTEHHESHAASAFFPSPFSSAAVLCMDGVGEWATTSAWMGQDNRLDPLWEIQFPHSLGLLYSAFTYYTGFKVNSGEYKVMGLAPYGQPTFAEKIFDHLIDVKPDGTFRLNMKYFDFATGLTMTNGRFDALFGGPPRRPETPLTQREMDLARSVQEVTEEVVRRMAISLRKETGAENLCLAGGVALNCVSNGKLLRSGEYKGLWIQPAAGDAGAAVGAAFAAYHGFAGNPRSVDGVSDAMRGAYLGPSYDNDRIAAALTELGAKAEWFDDEALLRRVASQLAEGKVVGWFQGRMEFGPRALGARSILGDARIRTMQSVMNLKIKHRESFRPFAPAIRRERLSDYFEMASDSPYMLLVADVVEQRRLPVSSEHGALWGIDRLNVARSDIPAVTHVNYSARVQTVHAETNPRFFGLLGAFEALTGCPLLVNTSFNVRGEPIVCTPEDAYRCFMRTEMDVLVLENFVLLKAEQPAPATGGDWQREFQLD